MITLLPVLGFAQSGPQLVADRYSYIACMTLALLGGAVALLAVQHPPRGWSRATTARGVAVVSIVVVIALSVMTGRQTFVWRTSQTLWERAIAVSPDSRYAHFNLGTYLANRKEYDRAIALFERAIEIDPTYAGAIALVERASARS